jgi:hypothetical protein
VVRDIVWSRVPLNAAADTVIEPLPPATPDAAGYNVGRRWLIGKVTTDAAGEVTAVDNTVAQSIASLGGTLAQLRSDLDALNALFLTLTGAEPAIDAQNILWDSTNPTGNTIAEEVIERDNAVKAFAQQLADGSNVLPMLTDEDILTNNVYRMATSLTEVHPTGTERVEMGTVLVNFWGDGTNDSPDFDNGGTLPGNPQTMGFEP